MKGKRYKAKRIAKAIVESNSFTEAYMKTHPKSTRGSAGKNTGRLHTKEVFEELDRMIDAMKTWEINKDSLTKLLKIIINNYLVGHESATNCLRAIELASKLVPEFVDRTQISDYSKLSEEELDTELRYTIRQLGMQDEAGTNQRIDMQ